MGNSLSRCDTRSHSALPYVPEERPTESPVCVPTVSQEGYKFVRTQLNAMRIFIYRILEHTENAWEYDCIMDHNTLYAHLRALFETANAKYAGHTWSWEVCSNLQQLFNKLHDTRQWNSMHADVTALMAQRAITACEVAKLLLEKYEWLKGRQHESTVEWSRKHEACAFPTPMFGDVQACFIENKD